jgi:hypothetical protein
VIENLHTSKSYEKALLEAALRLSWYMETYGPIPEKELLKLRLACIHPDVQTDKLFSLARDIRDHLLEIAS